MKNLKFFYRNNNINTLKIYVIIGWRKLTWKLSQIFGELITLIEHDKEKERIRIISNTSVTKKPFFQFQANYLVGTMNTADRSVLKH